MRHALNQQAPGRSWDGECQGNPDVPAAIPDFLELSIAVTIRLNDQSGGPQRSYQELAPRVPRQEPNLTDMEKALRMKREASPQINKPNDRTTHEGDFAKSQTDYTDVALRKEGGHIEKHGAKQRRGLVARPSVLSKIIARTQGGISSQS